MRFNQFCASTFLLFICSNTPALAAYLQTNSHSFWRPVIEIASGAAIAKIGQTETETEPVTLYGANENTYQANDPYRSRLMFGGFLGIEFAPTNSWFLYQIGLGYYQINSLEVTGILYQASNISMDYDNFDYQFYIQSRQFLLQSKILLTLKEIFHPYFLVGAGLAVNDAYNYQEEPRYSYSGPSHTPFADHTTDSFTYAIGLGLDVDLSSHFRLGAGYQFADLGKYSLGSSPAVNSGSSLSQSHIYTHEILLQLTYLV